MGRGFESRRDHDKRFALANLLSFNREPCTNNQQINMADNYLEKQYADYEKRRAEWERQKKLGKLPKKKA